jgi:pteridine reductase
VDERPFDGRLALVTGAAKRLGRGIAFRLAALGCDVVVHHHTSRGDAERLCDELAKRKVNAYALAADLSSAEDRAKLVPWARKAAGKPIDFLVNNAAVFPEGKLAQASISQLHWTIGVNAWAPFELTRAFAAQVGERRQGAVVNLIDSRVADYDWDHAAYHLSKRMLADLTQLAAVEYAPRVRVNGVAPGPVKGISGRPRAQEADLVKHMPLLRLADADDVADAVLYLLGARSVTGQTIYVDGGRHLGRGVFA